MPDWERESASKTTSHAKGEISLASSSAAVQPTEAARASERKDSLPTFCSCQYRCACDLHWRFTAANCVDTLAPHQRLVDDRGWRMCMGKRSQTYTASLTAASMRGGRGGGERSACACFRLQNPRRCGVLAAHGWAPAFSKSGAENCGSFFGQRGNLEVRVSLLSRDALRGKASSQRAHASRSAGPSTMLPSASKKASIAGSSPILSHSSIRCHRPRTLTTSMAATLGPDARRSEALQKVRVAVVDATTDDAVVGAAVIATKGR
mmetsp:Transcript_14641/g.47019  ORF Transcript_14641/g.47019 Transcript_14641/m.47019 type:complete len:264 (-) Transcript_14641:83-874(-)